MQPDLENVPGLTVLEAGATVLSGPLAALDRKLDDAFVGLAARWGSEELRFPPHIAARHLERVDWFHSFPHLATFPVTLEREPENLAAFARRDRGDGCVRLTRTEAVKSVLSPAACYHVYPALEDRRLEGPLFVTTRGTCFRHEESYAPLRRQWAFSMREVVCLGAAADVAAFLEEARERAGSLARRLGLAAEWQAATDPFFRPERNPAHLLQKVAPIKHELVADGDLALASVNFHRDRFGEAFGITLSGVPVFSGCLAFGVERWIHSLLATHGPHPSEWSFLEEVERG